MFSWRQWLGQALFYSLFFGLVGYFSSAPVYQRYDHDLAMIKLSLQHAGKTLGECQIRSAEELAQLAPNMRIAKICPRQRSPLQLDLLIDGLAVYSEQLDPRGIHNDGLTSVYFRVPVDSGKIDLLVRMKDHLEQAEFPYQLKQTITLKPAQVLVIDFDDQGKKFTII